MRLVLAMALAAGMAAPAMAQPGARPQPSLIAELERYCIATDAQPLAAVAAADRDGWMEVPEEFMASAPRDLTGLQARLRTSRAGMRLLFAGRGRFPAGGQTMDMDLCLVGVRPGDFAQLAADARGWLAMAPMRRDGEQVMYGWFETARGRRPLSRDLPEREAEALLQSGAMRMVMVMGDPEMTMIGYAMPRLRGRAL